MIAATLAVALQAASLASSDLPLCTHHEGSPVGTYSLASPELDVVREVEVGQPLLSSVRAEVFQTGMRLNGPVVVRGRSSRKDFTLTVPESARVRQEAAGWVPSDFEFKYDGEVSATTGMARPTQITFLTDRAQVRVSWGYWKEHYPLPEGFGIVEAGRCFAVTSSSLTRELVYTGVSQGSISLDYRELSGNLARPAFDQTVRYDLGEGREIGFRGARFEILDASNVSVRYRVTRPLAE